jgi:hypothetical protein
VHDSVLDLKVDPKFFIQSVATAPRFAVSPFGLDQPEVAFGEAKKP